MSTEQNEENTVTIGTDNEELEKPSESEIFIEAENDDEESLQINEVQ